MRTLVLFTGLAVLLSGCATAANLADDAAITAWLGAHGNLRASGAAAHQDGAVPHNAPAILAGSQGFAGQAATSAQEPQVQSRPVPRVPAAGVEPTAAPGSIGG